MSQTTDRAPTGIDLAAHMVMEYDPTHGSDECALDDRYIATSHDSGLYSVKNLASGIVSLTYAANRESAIAKVQREKLAWKTVSDDGLPRVGVPVIVTIVNHLYSDRRELVYPVYYMALGDGTGYGFCWVYGGQVINIWEEHKEVIAWMEMPRVYEGAKDERD